MSNGSNSSHSGLPESEESKDTSLAHRRRESSTAPPLIGLLSRVLKRIQIIAIKAAGMLGGLTPLASRLSRSMKRGTTIAALVTAAVVAGNAVSAQVANSPPPLSQVPIPKPDKLGDYVKNEQAAIALGKSLFWDMQLGSDGIQSCGTKQAADALLEIPAVGRNGGNPLPNFLGTYSTTVTTTTP